MENRLNELAEKAKNQTLSPEEQQEFLTLFNQEMVTLEKEQPEKYLEILKVLNKTLDKVNDTLAGR